MEGFVLQVSVGGGGRMRKGDAAEGESEWSCCRDSEIEEDEKEGKKDPKRRRRRRHCGGSGGGGGD